MLNAETAYNVKTFHLRSVMFARNYQGSKHPVFLQFQVWGVKPRGGGWDKTDFNGALTHPVHC